MYIFLFILFFRKCIPYFRTKKIAKMYAIFPDGGSTIIVINEHRLNVIEYKYIIF